MTDICAAILLEQLKKIDFMTKKRIENANCLIEGLKEIKGIKTPSVKKDNTHAFHQFTIRVEDDFKLSRDELMHYLKEKGINTAIYYPKPLHLCEHFKNIGYKQGDFPIAEKVSKQVLSLPVHPHLTQEQLNTIINAFKEVQ